MPAIAHLDLDSRSYDQKLAQSAAKTEAAAKRMESGVKSAGAAVTDSFGSKMRAGAGMLMGVLGVAGVLGTIMKIKQALTGLVTSSDMTSKMSRNLGVTGEQLQGLQYAARSAGMEVDSIPTAFARMKKEAGDALNGEQMSIDKFNRIGISMEKLKGKKPWEIFEMTAEALNAIQDPAEKSAAGMDIFGRSFDKMQNFLRDYKGSIDNLQGQGIITEDHLQAAEKLTQKIEDLQTALNALVVNSGFIEDIHEVLEGLDAWLNMTNKIKNAGIVTREQAVSEAIGKAESSGKYTPEQIQEMKSAKKPYSGGSEIGLFGTGFAYKKGYSLLDQALVEANPSYRYFARNASGAFSGTGQMTMPISREQAAAEKARREEVARKRAEAAAERQKTIEEYKNRLIEKAVEQYRFQYNYQKLMLEGKFREAEILKQTYELEKKNGKASSGPKIEDIKSGLDAKKAAVDAATKEYDSAKKAYDEKRQSAGVSPGVEDIKSGLDAKKAAVDAATKEYDAAKKAYATAKEKLSVEEKIKQEILAQSDAINKLSIQSYIQDLQDQLQLQTYLVNKEYEKYSVMKMQLDLKGKQKEATEEEKKKILEAADAMNKLDLKQSLTEQGRSLVYDAMKKAGFTKEADRQKAIDDAEKKRKAKLTENERNYVISLADLTGQLSEITQPDLKGLEIRTNELTARGGFSTGAVVPDKDAVNKKIAENQKTTNDLLIQIKTLVTRLEEVPL